MHLSLRKAMAAIATKACKGCKVEKPTTDYRQDKSGALGVRGSCKLCEGKASRTLPELTDDVIVLKAQVAAQAEQLKTLTMAFNQLRDYLEAHPIPSINKI